MSIQTARLATQPIFFERNRVFRVYTGGKLFHGLFGDTPIDSDHPEEWIASDVRALNQGNVPGGREGISKIENTDLYFDQLIAAEKALMLGPRNGLNILIKVLDSAIRLPVQVHPDKDFSKRQLSCDCGKTEAWLILATRENACIYYGFKHRVSRAEFEAALEGGDAVEALIQHVPVRAGDVFLVPAGMIHAIGGGCLILEIQEPTDFTVQPEAYCGSYKLSYAEQYMGLDRETALGCFDFDQYGEAALQRGWRTPTLLYEVEGVKKEVLIGEKDTDCFSMNRLTVNGGTISALPGVAVYVVTAGCGVLSLEGYSREIKAGDYFFLPHSVDGKCAVSSVGSSIELIECLPPTACTKYPDCGSAEHAVSR